MGTFSIWHWVIVLAVVLVLFGGKGKISSLMGDFGKGLKSFKKGMKEDEAVEMDNEVASEEAKILNSQMSDVTEDTISEKDKTANG